MRLMVPSLQCPLARRRQVVAAGTNKVVAQTLSVSIFCFSLSRARGRPPRGREGGGRPHCLGPLAPPLWGPMGKGQGGEGVEGVEGGGGESYPA